MSVTILQGHVLDVLPAIAAGSVHCCVTSIPYFGLRAYGCPPQIWDASDPACPHRWGEIGTVSRRGQAAGDTARVGNTVDRVCPPVIAQGAHCLDCGAWLGEYGSEKTPAAFVRHTVVIARAIRRVLHATGTLWLNVGDSHAGDCSYQVPDSKYKDVGNNAGSRVPDGYQQGDLLGIPGRIAEALQEDGWHRRADISWLKRSPMPESVSGVRWERHRIKTAPQPERPHPQLGGTYTPNSGGFTSVPPAEWEDCPGCPICAPHDGLVLRWGHGRPTRATEMIYLFGNTERHYYDLEATRVQTAASSVARLAQNVAAQEGSWRANGGAKTNGPLRAVGDPSTGRNLWNWWEFSSDPDDAWFLTPEQQSDEFCGACLTLFDAKSKRRIKRVTGEDGTEQRVCPVCQETERWVGHYAAFPSELPHRAIKAGTSQVGCCPKCLEPWARVVERKTLERYELPPEHEHYRPGRYTNHGAVDPVSGGGQRLSESTTLGWLPTCECLDAVGQPFAPIPCTVLDPFSGSGTTPREADRLGRTAVAGELNPDYVAFQKARLERDAGLFAAVDVTEVVPTVPSMHTQLPLLAGEEAAG